MKDMKLKHFFFAAILTAGITACSDDDNVVNNQDPTGVQAYMTLQIVGPQGADTRTTPGEDQTELGTAVENKISNVTILLCNSTTDAVVASFSTGFTLTATDNNGVVTSPIAIPENVSAGTYEVYVIANDPTTSLFGTSDNVTTKTIDGITMANMKSQYAANDKFLMFNESNGTEDIAGAQITISENNSYENPAKCAVPIELDRLAVKIRSKAAETIDINGINGTDGEFNAVKSVTLQGFKLLNGATKVNLQQEWTKKETEQGTNYPWINTLVTPILSAGKAAGTETEGYYNHLSDFRTITQTNGIYSVVKDTYATVDAYGNTAMADIYCMENNPTWDGSKIVDALKGNTTGLVYQWKVTIKDKSGQTGVSESDELAGENCFYSYNNEYYATLDALLADYPGILEKETTGTTNNEKKTAIKKELTTAYNKGGTVNQDGISSFRTKYNIKVYTDGIMYYTYYIKDQNYKQGEAGKEETYYSVMRNTVYDLTVTKLQQIGTDIPGGWNPDADPEDPVEPTNVYMVVEAQANPWVVSKEDITLE